MPLLTALTETAKRLARLETFPQPRVIALRRPVLLMHGLGVLGALQRGGYLHQEALCLRVHGVRAYAPNVAPYHSISVRADMWKACIEHVLDETGEDALTLVAHSMGGLDARYLISKMGLHDHVQALVTIATPHRGTAIATLMLNQPDLVREGMAGVANYVGMQALQDTTSDVLQALSELTPEYVRETFNPDVPDHPSVRYWSYAARAGRGTDVPIDPLFYALNRLLYKREGVNDGYVSVESAKWGTFLGTIDADHARQVGLSSRFAADFDADAFYTDIVRMLADEGF